MATIVATTVSNNSAVIPDALASRDPLSPSAVVKSEWTPGLSPG